MQATQQHQEALQAAESAWEDRRSSLLAAQLAAELRATDAEEQLAGQEGASSLDGPGDPSGEPSGAREHPPSQHPPPPAMAAPGRSMLGTLCHFLCGIAQPLGGGLYAFGFPPDPAPAVRSSEPVANVQS